MNMKHAELIPVVVSHIKENGIGNISLHLKAENGLSLPVYSPGAHIDIFIPNIGPRQYSLCTEECHGEYYEICVKLADDSRGGSRFLHQHIQAGDCLNISQPRNHFLLPTASRYLLFAGGIGITPLLAMAEHLAAQHIDFELHYYVSHAQEAAFTARCSAPLLADKVFLHNSQAQDSLRQVYPDSLRHPQADSKVIACGPDGFIQRLQDIMQQHRWQPAQLSFERFSHTILNNSDDAETFHIEINSSGQRFLIGPHQTIAEVLLSEKINIALSCEQGICGSCITDVISGIPDHRDCVLTDEEKAENTQITLCCSRSKSPVLVLDL